MKINIGTTEGNIVGVEIKKPFKKITPNDIYEIVKQKFGGKRVTVIGWCPNLKRKATKK